MNVGTLLNGRTRRAVHTHRYSTRAVLRKENIAEHQWLVAFYSLAIAEELIFEGFTVDKGKLLTRSIVHDIEETHTGDFLRKIKHANPEILAALEQLGLEAVTAMDDELGCIGLVDHWKNAKDDSLEGQIIRLADVMAVVSYLVEERQMGNRTLADVDQEVLDYLNIHVAFKLKNQTLFDLCVETALYLCERCELPAHAELKRKAEKLRERKNRSLRS